MRVKPAKGSVVFARNRAVLAAVALFALVANAETWWEGDSPDGDGLSRACAALPFS